MTGATPILDSILWFAGMAVALIGAVLIVWALWWDRARGRRRCPQCWYDMAGIPGMTCPECGRTVTSEKRLARTRRRWVWSGVAAVLLMSGVASMQVPSFRQGGWVGLVPSSVLIWWAPAENVAAGAMATPAAALLAQRLGAQGGPFLLPPPPPAPPPPPGFGLTTSERLTEEVWARLQRERLWGWQARIFVNRYLKKAGDQMPWEIRFLDRWPAGEPVRAVVRSLPWHAAITGRTRLELWVGDVPDGERSPRSEWYGADVSVLAGAPRMGEPNTVHLRAKVGDTVVFSRSWPLPCDIVKSKFEMVTPVDDAEFTSVVRGVLDPSLAEERDGIVLVVNDRASHAPWPDLDAAIVFEGEVLVDGVAVARSDTLWVERMRPVWKNWLEGPMEWLPGGRERLAEGRERAQVRIRASPGGAAAIYLAAPFSQPNSLCWTGEFTVPARWGPIERPRMTGNP